MGIFRRRQRGRTTGLMLAAGAGLDDEVARHHSQGVDLNEVDDDGDTALFYAATRGRFRTVGLLLHLGANANPRPGSNRETPLTAAARLAVGGPRPPDASGDDYRRVVLALLRGGASPEAMYRAGFRLVFYDTGGLVVIRLQDVPAFTHRDDLAVMQAIDPQSHPALRM